MPKSTTWIVVVSLSASLFFLGGADQAAPVSVQRSPETSATRQYDPAHPPAEMPPTIQDEAGVTVSQFSCTAGVEGVVNVQPPRGGQVVAEVQIDTVHITLGLNIVEWIMRGAPRKILDHENGHRMISERYYSRAEKVATDLGHEFIGRKVSATGPDVNAASKAALDVAAHQLTDQYMAKAQIPSQKAQEIYDRITQHGTNAVKESVAIEQAIKEADTPDKGR